VLAPLDGPPHDFTQLSEDPLFLVKIRSYSSIFAFTSIGASLTENSRIDEQLVKAREVVYKYPFRVQGTIYHRVGTLLPIESRTPGFAQLYAFDDGM
jgi:hypothetical protein